MPHTPLPVRGYTTRQGPKIDAANDNKILEELVLRQITHL